MALLPVQLSNNCKRRWWANEAIAADALSEFPLPLDSKPPGFFVEAPFGLWKGKSTAKGISSGSVMSYPEEDEGNIG